MRLMVKLTLTAYDNPYNGNIAYGRLSFQLLSFPPDIQTLHRLGNCLLHLYPKRRK